MTQLLTLGAMGQVILFAILPARYSLLPAVALFLQSVGSIVLQTLSPSSNTYAHGVVYNRSSAQLPAASYNPAKEGSLFGSKPAASGVVVLLLGFRITKPLGLFSPGGKELGAHFADCNKRLFERAQDFGCVGNSSWTAQEAANNNSVMSVYYFRDVEGLNRFAHDPVHRQAWDWYNSVTKKLGYTHLGIFHETYYSAPGQYETIYVNIPPLLMGATNVQTKNEVTGKDEWVRPLVSAENSTLRSQWGRMGRAVNEDGEAY